MAEINTFSSAVDLVATRSGRLDKKSDIAGYLRATMREAQVKSDFGRDKIEDQLSPTGEPYIWTYPTNFRQMLLVEYPLILDDHGKPINPRYMPPGKKLSRRSHDYFYYDAGDYFVFSGAGGEANNPGTINIAYTVYFLPFAYYSNAAERPATYDDLTLQWTYLTATTDAEKEAARDQVTNWLLFNWYDLCIEGALAKLFKSYNDPRQTSTFALFKSFEKDLLKGERRASIGGESA